MPSKSYPTPVESLPDQDLAVLSAELESLQSMDFDGNDVWADSEAEDRYYEMRAEVRRRWELGNPEEAEKQRNTPMAILVRQCLSSIVESFQMSRKVNEQFSIFSTKKIGDTITVRRPMPYAQREVINGPKRH